MPSNFNIPSGPAKYRFVIDRFRGVDLASAPENTDKSRSPDAPNMLRDEVGKVRKRMGYYKTLDLQDVSGVSPGAVLHGIYSYKDMDCFHVGTKLIVKKKDGSAAKYVDNGTTLADTDSVGAEFGNSLYLFDGNDMYSLHERLVSGEIVYVFGKVVGRAPSANTEAAYIPTVRIGGRPGVGADYPGGTLKESFNLLSCRWTESYNGSSESSYCFDGNMGGGDFYTHTQLVKCEVFSKTSTTDASGNPIYDWVNIPVAKIVGWNHGQGLPEYHIPSGKTKADCAYLVAPIFADPKLSYARTHWHVETGMNVEYEDTAGEDNIRLTFEDTRREKLRSKICKARCLTRFGADGAADRLFVGGSDAEPNVDYHSGYNNPVYFPDDGYSAVGNASSRIVGYGRYSNSLVTYLKTESNDIPNIVIRSGTLDDSGNSVFRIINTLSAPVVVGHAFISSDEALFMTEQGVYAVTGQDSTTNQVTQSRSYYIDPALRSSQHNSEAVGCVYNDFYCFALRDKIYLLDRRQPIYSANRPKSNYQYEAYTLEGFPDIKYIWCDSGKLRFATSEGRIYGFYDNVDSPYSYCDEDENGQPKAIEAHWDIPIFDGSTFFRNKTVRFISVRLASSPVTGVKVKAQMRGLWSEIMDSGGRARYFDWEYIDFAHLSFSADRTARTLGKKTRLKKFDKVRFRLENNELRQGLGIYAFGLEYTEPGSNYKK